MKKSIAIVLVWMMAISVFLQIPPGAGVSAASAELLANPGFETGSGGTPASWSQFVTADPVTTVTDRVYEGTRGIRLSDTSAQTSTGLRSAKVTAQAGAIYSTSVYAYIESGAPLLYMEYWDASGQRIAIQTETAAPASQWQQIVIQSIAPAGTVAASVLIYSSSTNISTAYFDNASLKEITANDLQILNSDFELIYDDGTPRQWTQLISTNLAYTATNIVNGGQRSAKLVDLTTDGGVGLRSSKVPVIPGQSYEATVHFYAIAGTPNIYLEFWNSSGQRIGNYIQANSQRNEWNTMVVQGTAPASAVAATILLYGSGTNVGTTYYDDVSLRMLSPEPVQSFTMQTAGYPRLNYTAAELPGLRAKAADTTATAFGKTGKQRWDEIETAARGFLNETSMTLRYFNDYPVMYPLTAGQLLANAGFEQQSGSIPAQWIQFNPSQLAASVTNTVYNGSYSVKITDPDTTSQPGLRSAKVNVTPNTAYQAAIYAYIESGSPLLYLEFWDAAGQRIGVKTQSGAASSAWKRITVEDAAPANAVSASVLIYSGSTNVGTAYFDDASLTALLPQQPAPRDPPPGFTAGRYPYWIALAQNLQLRMETLSLAYSITGEQAFADKAISYMLALSYWNVWADPNQGCGESCGETMHFTLGVSAVYDALYNQLTSSQRALVESALENKGAKPLYNDTIARIDGNGNIARAAALVSAGIVLHGKSPNANKYLTRAVDFFTWFMDRRMQSGQNEGFLYTDYSVENMVKAIEQLTRATGTDSLLQHPFLNDFAVRWAMYFMAPGGNGQAAFSDSLYNNHFHNAMSILNNRLGNGYAGWYLQEGRPNASPADQFLYYNPQGVVTSPDTLQTSTVLPEIGWAAFRSGWTGDDTLLAFVSNNSGFVHNHFDQNSFQIASGGSWIGRDPGYQDLSSGVVNDFTLKMGHSTLLVDGAGQNGIGSGTLTEGILSPDYDYVKGSAPDSYIDLMTEQSILNKFDRHIAYVKPGYFVVMDDIGADSPHLYEWSLFSGPLFDVKFDGQSSVAGATYQANELYMQNGRTQLSAKFLGEETFPMTTTVYPGAEKYGYVTKVGSGSAQSDYRFVTVMRAAPFDGPGYYDADELYPLLATSGKPVSVEMGAGVRHINYRASQVGDYVSFPVTVPEEGDYRFSTAFLTKPKYGKVQAYVDGQPVGGIFEGSYFAAIPAATERHGTIHLTAGTHIIRYEVAGNGETTNFEMAINAVELVPVNAASEMDPSMQIDASLLTTSIGQAIGARIERNDGSSVIDEVAFKTGSGEYTLGNIQSDAEQATVSKLVYGQFTGYTMTRGTKLTFDGVRLLESSVPLQASFGYEEESVMRGSIVASEANTFRLYTPSSVSSVFIDGVLLQTNDYTFDAITNHLELSLSGGNHMVTIWLNN